jgi:putative glutamine amidotransferase
MATNHDGSFAGAPLIGVTTSEMRVAGQTKATPEGEPPRLEMALGLTYLKAIEAAGGLPIVIPPLGPEAIAALVEDLDGVCLSGGPDLDPVAYEREPHPELGPTWRELDEAELRVAVEAEARELPILAICRGAQALNVARRGTLIQHLPESYGEGLMHRQLTIGSEPSHSVELEPDSVLARATGDTRLEVNSFHHQAVDQLGANLRVVAKSPDGVIEAIEATDREFVVGVQWHAESMAERPEQARLFAAFIEAARRQAAARRRLPTP